MSGESVLQKVGRGMNACVLAPPLPCAPDSGTDARLFPKTYVSKVQFTNKSGVALDKPAQEEYARAQLLRAVDPEGAFTVHVGGVCRPEYTADTEAVIRALCSLQDADRLGYQLFYERAGGRSLEEAAREDLPAAFHSLSNILYGLCVMTQNPNAGANILHRDLKHANIVVNEGGKASMVDYGTVCTAADMLADGLLLTGIDTMYPPEYDMLRSILNSLKLGKYEAVRTNTALHRAYLAEFYTQEQTEWDYANMDASVKYLLAVGEKDPDTVPRYLKALVVAVFSTKFDVFSLGITVAALVIQNRAQWAAMPADQRTKIGLWIYWTTCADVNKRFTPTAARAAWAGIWGLPST